MWNTAFCTRGSSAVCKTGVFTHGIHLPYVKQGYLHTRFICRVQNRAFYTREHRLLPGLIHRCHPLPGKLLSYIEIFFSYWVSIKWKIVLLLSDSINNYTPHANENLTLLYSRLWGAWIGQSECPLPEFGLLWAHWRKWRSMVLTITNLKIPLTRWKRYSYCR